MFVYLYSENRFLNDFLFYFWIARETLPLWDKQIQSLCYQVNKIIEKIGNVEPEWMAERMEEQMSH